MSRPLAHLPASTRHGALTVELVASPAALAEVYRLRRRIYVDELGVLGPDHPFVDGDALRDPYDAYSHQLLLREDGRPIGTLRLTVAAYGPLELEAYTDAPIGSDRQVAEGTRFMVSRASRRGPGARLLILAAYRHLRTIGVHRVICAGKVGNLGRYYANVGFARLSSESFTYDLVGPARYELLGVELGAPGSLAWLKWRVVVPVLCTLAFRLPALGDQWFRRGFSEQGGWAARRSAGA
ncbi:MAG: putative GNAT family N-acyltransferase [Myxococcota bacterium]|jgi:predicted GNAT family N-acyltransferase